jgi:hypothetical protein
MFRYYHVEKISELIEQVTGAKDRSNVVSRSSFAIDDLSDLIRQKTSVELDLSGINRNMNTKCSWWFGRTWHCVIFGDYNKRYIFIHIENKEDATLFMLNHSEELDFLNDGYWIDLLCK